MWNYMRIKGPIWSICIIKELQDGQCYIEHDANPTRGSIHKNTDSKTDSVGTTVHHQHGLGSAKQDGPGLGGRSSGSYRGSRSNCQRSREWRSSGSEATRKSCCCKIGRQVIRSARLRPGLPWGICSNFGPSEHRRTSNPGLAGFKIRGRLHPPCKTSSLSPSDSLRPYAREHGSAEFPRQQEVQSLDAAGPEKRPRQSGLVSQLDMSESL
jgi:hypothetical protein